MKKNIFFAVAFAALAFVACNKEENGKVAFNISGEKYENTDKQGFRNGRLYFTAGDEALVNGETSELVILSESAARLWVNANNNNGFLVGYPASSITCDASGNYKTTFKNNITLVPANSSTTTVMTDEAHQVWPMSNFAANVEEGANFKLYNNVAVLSPTVKYGYQFVNAMWGANGVDPIAGFVLDEANLPDLYITKVVLSSNNIRLTGSATLQNCNSLYNPDEDMDNNYGPYYKMDAAPIQGDEIVCNVVPAYHVEPTDANSTAINIQTFGHIAVAPCTVPNKNLTVSYYLKAIVDGVEHNYKYTAEITTGAQFRWKRSTSNSLIANFHSPDANLGSRITILN